MSVPQERPIQIIEDHLNSYGWSWNSVDPNTIASEFGDDESRYLIFFQIQSPWLRIKIPYLILIENPSVEQIMNILQMNSQLRLGRLGLDDKGQIALFTDLYLDDLRFETFEITLDALTYFAHRINQVMHKE